MCSFYCPFFSEIYVCAFEEKQRSEKHNEFSINQKEVERRLASSACKQKLPKGIVLKEKQTLGVLSKEIIEMSGT